VPPTYTRFKPPSKLINSWAAGCPALVGPEQAFAALRRSPLDYFEVNSPHDVLAALKRLNAEPELYRAMIANGTARTRDFTADAVARRWEELFAGQSPGDTKCGWLVRVRGGQRAIWSDLRGVSLSTNARSGRSINSIAA